MGGVDQGVIAEIKARLRIEDIVSRYVELRSVGPRLVAPCPFHQETQPSFSVNPEGGFYYCFGCQASGDIIDFYRAINGLDFREALEVLAREAGVSLQSSGPKNPAQRGLRTACLEMHAQALIYFRQHLQSTAGQVARTYLAQRGLTQEVQQQFSLGFSPDAWNGLRDFLRGKGFDFALQEKAGLISLSAKNTHYDRFRARLMFPIMNLSGQTVAFGARILSGEGTPKYINSSETPIYTKGEHLYGLYQARRSIAHQKTVLLTEGYIDVLSLHQYGFTNSCGVLGTALTAEQVHRLGGLTGQIVLLFDGDGPGRKAALRSAEMILTQGLSCQVLCLPEGEDVDSVLQKKGPARLQHFLTQAVDGLEYCLQAVATGFAPKDMLRWAVGFVQKLGHLDWRAFYVPRIAAGLALSEKELRQALETSLKPAPQAREDLASSTPAQRDKHLLAFAIRFPEYHDKLSDMGMEQALQTERGRGLWRKIAGVETHTLLRDLDQGEKAFYVRNQMRPDVTQDDGRREWEELQGFLQQLRIRQKAEDVHEALRRARSQGDFQEELRLLALLQDQD